MAFLFSDTQIINESFVEDINNMLNSGEVPNIFPNDERVAICEVESRNAYVICCFRWVLCLSHRGTIREDATVVVGFLFVFVFVLSCVLFEFHWPARVSPNDLYERKKTTRRVDGGATGRMGLQGRFVPSSRYASQHTRLCPFLFCRNQLISGSGFLPSYEQSRVYHTNKIEPMELNQAKIIYL